MAINLFRSAFGGLFRKSNYITSICQLSTVIQQKYASKTTLKIYRTNQHNGVLYQSKQAYSSECNENEEKEISERVMKVCRTFQKLANADMNLDSHFMRDLGLKPLEHVEVLAAMEDEFDFEIPDNDVKLLVRPMDIIKYVAELEDEYD